MLFPVTVRTKKVLRSGKNERHYFLLLKCVFYACFMLAGSWQKRLLGRDLSE